MRSALIVLLAVVMIAAAILVTNRWEIVAGPAGLFRLDRWTGNVSECRPAMLTRHLDCG